MHTTINYNEFCTKRSKKFEDELEATRMKTGLGYLTSRYTTYKQPKTGDYSHVTEKLSNEVKEYYRSIKGKYKFYWERNGFTDTGYKNEQYEQDIKDQDEFNREAITNRLTRDFSIQRKHLDELSMDRLMKLVERIGEESVR